MSSIIKTSNGRIVVIMLVLTVYFALMIRYADAKYNNKTDDYMLYAMVGAIMTLPYGVMAWIMVKLLCVSH